MRAVCAPRATLAAAIVRRRQLIAQPRSRRRLATRPPAAAAASGSAADDSQPRGSGASSSASGGGGLSFGAGVLTLTNVIMGAGAVGIPYALAQGGWAALLVLLLLGCCFSYTGTTLLQCCALVDEQRQRQQGVDKAAPPAGYQAVAAAAFGAAGARVVSAVMLAELLGICTCYIVLEAETLAALLAHSGVGQALVAALGLGQQLGFGLLACAVVAPTVLLPDLEALSALGALGVAAAAAVGVVLACLLLSGGPGAGAVAGTELVRPAGLPQALGMMAFVYAGHATFPVIVASLRDGRAAGPRAIQLGYAATAAICSLLGACGYALAGSNTAPVITANLPPGSALAAAVTALTLVNPAAAFAPTLEPVALALQRRLLRGRPGGGDAAPYALRAGLRLGLALACCGAALLLPYVAEVTALVGALLTMSVSLILPAAFHAVLMARAGRLDAASAAADAGALLLGVACAAVGASAAAANLRARVLAGV